MPGKFAAHQIRRASGAKSPAKRVTQIVTVKREKGGTRGESITKTIFSLRLIGPGAGLRHDRSRSPKYRIPINNNVGREIKRIITIPARIPPILELRNLKTKNISFPHLILLNSIMWKN